MKNKYKNSSNCPSTALRESLPPEQLSVKSSNNRLADFQVFPNPNDGNFSVIYELEETGTLLLIDPLGRTVQSVPLPADKGRIEVLASELKAGLYYLQVVSDNKQILYTDKIIIH